MPELLDRGDHRAYYFGRRTAEKRIFIEQKVSITELATRGTAGLSPGAMGAPCEKHCIVNCK